MNVIVQIVPCLRTLLHRRRSTISSYKSANIIHQIYDFVIRRNSFDKFIIKIDETRRIRLINEKEQKKSIGKMRRLASRLSINLTSSLVFQLHNCHVQTHVHTNGSKDSHQQESKGRAFEIRIRTSIQLKYRRIYRTTNRKAGWQFCKPLVT